jgi:ABC-2 type transport system ATP-binding protein
MNHAAPIVAVRDLDFAYAKRQPVLRDLQLTVPRGAIYGFLGGNGAGKSTSIRTILGLLHPQRGHIELFGTAAAGHRRLLHRRIGSLIEAPSLYAHLSGYENLRIAAKYWDLPGTRITAVLETVGLSYAARQRVGNYSTGMKQRLGLAMALLADPELLILDEPTNGLDPSGIREIRTTLLRLNAAGKTILLSSHLLSEVEKIATQVGILKAGKLVFEGSIEALEQLRRRQQRVDLITPAASRAAELLASGFAPRVLASDRLELRVDDRNDLPRIIRELTQAGVDLYEVTPRRNDLEDLFLELTTA